MFITISICMATFQMKLSYPVPLGFFIYRFKREPLGISKGKGYHTP